MPPPAPPTASPREHACWYFDIVSPFSHLHLAAVEQLDDRVDIEYVPVLLAGLLKHWGQLGPAEVPAKRVHTYRYCTWLAHRQGLPFRFPPRHPFNPLSALRLILALGADHKTVRTVFDFIYAEGRGIDDADGWAALCQRLGVDDSHPLISAPAVKQQLMANTKAAIDAGVFGVPTLACRGELFWGADAQDMFVDFLDDPKLMDSTEMRRLAQLPSGAQRR